MSDIRINLKKKKKANIIAIYDEDETSKKMTYSNKLLKEKNNWCSCAEKNEENVPVFEMQRKRDEIGRRERDPEV